MAETGVVFLFAALYHPALRHTAVPRRELGVRPSSIWSGRWRTRPGRAPMRSRGGSADGPVIAGVLAGRGCSGPGLPLATTVIDELTTTALVDDVGGAPRHGEPDRARSPAELGISRAAPEDLRGGAPAHNAEVARAVPAASPARCERPCCLNRGGGAGRRGGSARPGPGCGGPGRRLCEGRGRGGLRAARALLERWAEASQRLAAERS